MKRLVIAIIAGLLLAMGLLLIGPQLEKPKMAISITFDDGYVSQYNASKMLEDYGWRGVIYFPSGLAGGYFENIPLMSWEQILDLQKRGHEIGGHTLTHAKASNLSESSWEYEVKQGKDLLEQHNITANSFAYPYNDVNYVKIVKKYFSSQRTVNGGINQFDKNATEINGLALTHNNYQEVLPEYLAELKATGGWLILVIHNVDENPRPDIDLSKEEFTWVLDQIRKSGVPVKTISGVLKEIP